MLYEVITKGNANTHIILRGGKEPNYEAHHIAKYEKRLEEEGINPAIMVDCSHANSCKKAANQSKVLENVGEQIIKGNKSIMGVMIESNIHAGKQAIPSDLKLLKYGVSVTDECVGWEDTEIMLRKFAEQVRAAK